MCPHQSISRKPYEDGLEFPDWSGMLPHRNRMTFEQAVRWNEEMLTLFPLRKQSAKLEAERRCHAEFIL